MATQPNRYNDWPAGNPNGFNYGVDLPTYPFLNYPTKDTATKLYTVSRKVIVANYAPQAALAPYSGNPNAYLVDESEMQIDDLEQGRLMLQYAMVPTNQVQFISRSITRPQPRNTYVQTTGQASAPVTVELYHGGSALDVADDGSYIGGCLVTGVYRSLFAPTQLTRFIGNSPNIEIVSTAGLNASNSMAIYDSTTDGKLLIYAPTEWNVVNGTYINVSGAITSGIKYFAPFLKNYSPGTPTVPTQQTESFYLPTITANINTPSDISTPDIVSDDIDYFTAVSENASNLGTNYVNYDFDGPAVWKGPIYRLAQWDILAGDL